MTTNRHSGLHPIQEASVQTATCGENPTVVPADPIRDASSDRKYQTIKRAMDVLVCLPGLLLLAPLFVAIAIAIKLTSAGPVLFRQQRFGKNLEPFTFYKFRSMYVNCDQTIHKAYVASLIAGCPDVQTTTVEKRTVFKITRDPRVTSFGKFLRRASLDELPQLWNVLRGDMSLVGPRPCMQYELEHYAAWHTFRLIDVKPGMTGLWQVKGRSMVGFDEMVKLDLAYAEQRSLWLDLKILLRTPWAVVSGLGAC